MVEVSEKFNLHPSVQNFTFLSDDMVFSFFGFGDKCTKPAANFNT